MIWWGDSDMGTFAFGASAVITCMAFIGGVLSIGGNALVAHFVFKMTPATPPLLILGAVATAAAVTVVTGLLTSRGVTDHPPLEILRQET